MIEVKNLTKRYGDDLALDHISFTAENGKIYGLLGPNGAGKSTTMNIITGYTGATEGDVLINGTSILEKSGKTRKQIGYLPEQPPVYTDMTPYEYLNFAAELKKIPEEDREREVERVIELTGISNMRDRLIGNLSKGYRQRTGLAQAILGMPEILILDEPTVGLDPGQIIEIRGLIRSFAKEHTVIFSSHILSEVQELCDYIMIINHGRLVACGTMEELENILGSNEISVTVKSEFSEQAARILSRLNGVLSSRISDRGGETVITLSVSKGLDLREAVFSACVEGNIQLLALKPSEFSLEQVYLQITMDDGLQTEEERVTERKARRKGQR